MFFIKIEKNSAILYATTNKKYKIQLISKMTKNPWDACNFTELSILETHLANLLNKYNLENLMLMDLTVLIKSFIFQHFDQL